MDLQNTATELFLGIDIGSTTAKIVLRNGDKILLERYERHFSQVREKTAELLRLAKEIAGDKAVKAAISGSAGLGLAEAAHMPFVQEVYATAEAVKKLAPDTGMVIELGGEDAKILFLTGGTEVRMNGSCAGGTGAFIDQMAVLLDMSVDEMDAASLEATQIYPIASRCGVFAKTDVQPLLNQGAAKADVAASIYQAVVNQTITGLAQGRRITGKVMFLGGPLHYCKGLVRRFRETLHLDEKTGILPEYALYAVALGTAMYASHGAATDYDTLVKSLTDCAAKLSGTQNRLPPLFTDEAALAAFRARHAEATVGQRDIESYSGRAWLGIDCGSTTTKLVLIAENKEILYTYYNSNRGNPVSLVREELLAIRRACGDRIQEGDIVILDSNWKFPPFTPETNSPADKRLFVNAETANWMRDHKVKCVGFGDGVSIENCEADVKPFHDIIMAYDGVFLEVLKNLEYLQKDTFFMSYSPLPIVGADSCPVRAYAIEGLPGFGD